MQRKWKRRWQRLAKTLVSPVMAGLLFLSAYSPAFANPTGGTVTSGATTIATSGSTMTINQTTNKASINWQNFSIGSGETVNFVQPNSNSVALNRVIGNDASRIYGSLNANGKVYLVNPNGILFAKGAQVNVGGLVASTLNITDSDFLAGKYTFSGSSSGSVVNQGTITAANEAVLIGPKVVNEGVVAAKVVGLGAGKKVSLDFSGDSLLNVTVDTGTAGGNVANSGTITAAGGLVVMSAGTKDALLNTVVNNSGVIRAQNVTNYGGVIRLEGTAATNSGILDASGKAAGQTGGTVKVLGDTVTLASGSTIDVSGAAGGGTALVGGAYQGGGSEYAATITTVANGATINADAITSGNGGQVVVWANDKTDFAGTITARGGNLSGDGGNVETSGKKTLSVSGTVLAGASNGNGGSWLLDPEYSVIDATAAQSLVTALTAGATVTNSATNITVSSPISWSTDNSTLALSATDGLAINANITASGSGAGLALNGNSYSLGSGTKITLSGSGATFSLNGTPYTVINEFSSTGALQALQEINSNLSGNYVLGIDLDASSISSWIAIGSSSASFTGTFDGLGHTINNLTISSSSNYVGLFGYSSGTIRNLGLIDATVSGGSYVGALAGYNNTGGAISNCYVTVTVGSSAKVSGAANVGGLVGYNYSGTITGSHSDVTVTATAGTDGNTNAGGLVGKSKGSLGSISGCYSTGDVSASGAYIGGLVGYNDSCTISNCYSSGDVTMTSGTATAIAWCVGGLVGYNKGAIMDCYATGDILSLNGYNKGTSTIADYYACAGGLVGYNKSGNITRSYSTGSVTSNVGRLVGGLVGWLQGGTISGCYHTDGAVAGTDVSVGGLVGGTSGGTIVEYSYNTADVMGSAWVGGLLGNNYGTLRYSYNMGAVSGIASGYYHFGGLVGLNNGEDGGGVITQCFNTGSLAGAVGNVAIGGVTGTTKNGDIVTSCYWSTDNNASISSDSSGLTLAQMKNFANFTGWDIATAGGSSSIWRIYEGDTYPLLRTFLTGLIVTANSNTSTYNGSAYSGTVNYSTAGGTAVNSALINDANLKYTYTDSDGNPAIAKNAGTYSVSASGLYSSQQGYDISYASGIVTVNPKILTVTQAATVTKTYDGTTNATIDNSNLALSGVVSGDSVSVSGSGTYAGKNAGASSVKVTGVTLSNGNYTLAASNIAGGTLAGQINPKALSATQAATVTKTYDGTGDATITATNLNIDTSDVIAGDSVSIVSGTGTYAGASSVKVTGVTLSNGNYTLAASNVAGGTLTGQISPKALSATQAATVTKTYDGTTNATIDNSNLTLSGVVSGDSVSVSGSGTYAGKNAGASSVTVTDVTLSNGNYTLAISNVAGGTLTGQISPKALSATQAATVTKTYDGTTNATIDNSNLALSGVVSGDSVSVSGSGTYAGKNAGASSVKVTGVTLSNGNYTLAASNIAGGTLAGQISPKALSATQAATVTRTYDGTTNATIDNSNLTLSGVVSGDSVSVSGSGTYAGKNAGASSVKVTGVTLSNGNYTLAASNIAGGTLAGQINPKALSATQAATVTKTYDGTGDATITATNLNINTSDVIAGDSVSIVSGTGTYAGKNAGASSVTVTGVTLSNGNYTLAASNVAGGTLAGQISPKALSATQAATVTRTYDGTTNATIDNSNLTLSGVVSGDSVSVSGSGTYASKNAGASSVTVSGVTLSNGNYTLAISDVVGGTLAGQINPKALSATQAATVTKTYDGAGDATITATNLNIDTSDVIAGDSVSIVSGTGTYAGKNAGASSVTVTGVTLSNGNYTLAASNVASGTLTGRIDPKALTATQAAAVTKTYDGTNNATFDNSNLTLNGVVSGDSVSVSGSGTYAGKNVGASSVTVTSMTLSNGNYTLAVSDVAGGTLSGQISKASLIITASDAVKIYGQTATLSDYTVSGMVSGDSMNSVTLTSNGADAAAKAGKYGIIVSNALGSGLDNYNITYRSGTLTVTRMVGQDNGYQGAVVSATSSSAGQPAGRYGPEDGTDFLSLSIVPPGVNIGGYVPFTVVGNSGQPDN